MGVPFVTLAGGDTISRVGEGILNAVGLPQLVASNPAGYISIAADAVADLQRIVQWRREIRPRL